MHGTECESLNHRRPQIVRRTWKMRKKGFNRAGFVNGKEENANLANIRWQDGTTKLSFQFVIDTLPVTIRFVCHHQNANPDHETFKDGIHHLFIHPWRPVQLGLPNCCHDRSGSRSRIVCSRQFPYCRT